MEVSILIIRQERPEDYDTVYHVVKEAFEKAEYTGLGCTTTTLSCIDMLIMLYLRYLN